eukprot:scaffold101775_cov69-Phaeocystis_antarctica.AAC.2
MFQRVPSFLYTPSVQLVSECGVYGGMRALALALGVLALASPALGQEEPPLQMHLRPFNKDALERALVDADEFQLDRKDRQGNTALMVAVCSGILEAVQMLVEAGASTTVRYGGTKGGFSVMHAAAFNGRAEVLSYMLQRAKDSGKNLTVALNQRHKADGHAPLHRAAWGVEERFTRTIKVLLEAGADHNLRSSSNKLRAVEMTEWREDDGTIAGNKASKQLLTEWEEQHPPCVACTEFVEQAECHAWAEAGECATNVAFMRDKCRKSCGACCGADMPDKEEL